MPGLPENRNQPESTGIHRNQPQSTGINRNQNEVYRNYTLNLRNQLPENRNQPESTEINKNEVYRMVQVYHQVHVKPTDINRNPRQLCINQT